MPATFEIVSKQITGKVLLDDPLNQEYVSVMKIQQLVDKGLTNKQIAEIWNGSLGGSEKPIAKHGINKWKVKFDTVSYANKVLSNIKIINQFTAYADK